MNELLEHIREYFNNFNNKEYKIYLHDPRDWDSRIEWYSIDSNNNCIILRIQTELGTGCEWNLIHLHEIEAISMTSTTATMNIKKSNGKEYKLVAKFEPDPNIYDWNGPE